MSSDADLPVDDLSGLTHLCGCSNMPRLGDVWRDGDLRRWANLSEQSDVCGITNV
ncbi:MAG: hypothetical protein Kow0074_13010 [Candidatus Zixiibacteriota bacterium]